MQSFLINNKLLSHQLKELNLILDTTRNHKGWGKFIYGIYDVIKLFLSIESKSIVIKMSKLIVKGLEYDEGKFFKIKKGSEDSNDSKLNFVNRDTLAQTTALLSYFTKTTEKEGHDYKLKYIIKNEIKKIKEIEILTKALG